MDINSLLLTIASLSASFVAILGGFIASRLITINGERTSYERQLSEVTGQLIYYRGLRNMIDKNRVEEDGIRFIYDHMAELVDGESIEDVYEDAELQVLDIIELEPLWKQTQELKDLFDKCLEDKECRFNSDMIPITIAEEYSDNLFAYEFCKMYAGWGFSDYDFVNTPLCETGTWYERDPQKAIKYTTQILMLEARECQIKIGLKSLNKPSGMRIGLVLFILFSLFNIILPLVLSLFSFSEKNVMIAAIVVISLLMIGLTTTFIYLAWMLKWQRIDDN